MKKKKITYLLIYKVGNIAYEIFLLNVLFEFNQICKPNSHFKEMRTKKQIIVQRTNHTNLEFGRFHKVLFKLFELALHESMSWGWRLEFEDTTKCNPWTMTRP